MWRTIPFLLLVLALGLPFPAPAQDEPNLDAQQRLFSEVGRGFQAIRRGPAGKYYVLVAPAAAVLVFDAAGKKLGQVPAQPSGAAAIVFGVALDVDAAGQVYVADRGGNAVKIYAADGSLKELIPVTEPTGVATLSGGQFAVSSLSAGKLITIYSSQGRLSRSFGDLADLADSVDLNRHLNLGYLISDGAGSLYYAFQYLPEPTVRKYDSAGFLADEISLTTLDFQGLSQAARREIARADSGKVIVPHEIISAVGLDSASQEIWIALGDLLVRISPKGEEVSGMRTYTQSGERIASRSILVEPDRLLLGSDPLGIYAVVPKGRAAPAR